uniref:Uncharacterized protein n=1 Tax=Arundo donax TaxID=35708 RepID=A0A0A9GGZ5_ARUDO
MAQKRAYIQISHTLYMGNSY